MSPDAPSPSAPRTTSPDEWVQVRAIAETALALSDADARAMFLERACTGQPALRAAVERLVRACEVAGDTPGFLGEPAAVYAAPVLAAMSPRASPRGEAADAAIFAALRDGPGDRYIVEREIGRGGMARVYLARDVRHDRHVALKLLHPELNAVVGAERFLAEIRITASLQHAGILALYDSGEVDGMLYYVMPLVDGESLRVRLQREGRLDVDDAVRLTVAIARALEHAHRRGVVHRDLKPENILIHEGEPLVADFGIALALARAGDARLTATGIYLGTPAYMSPEQAAPGKPLDARSDLFSLACVLYEMLAGAPPHGGESVPDVIASVLSQVPPSVRTVRPAVPVHVDAALQRALARQPAERFASAAEFADALEGHQATAPATVLVPRAPSRARRLLALTFVLGAVALGVSGWWRMRDHVGAAPAPATRFVLPRTDNIPIGSAPALSRSGRYVMYAGAAAAGRPLVVRPLDALDERVIAGTAGVVSAFPSPDGKWIGFFTLDDKLEKVPAAGGPVTELAGAFRFSTAQWAPGGAIVLHGYGAQRGLVVIADSGGAMQPLTRVNAARGELMHQAPYVLAGGHTVAFTVQRQRGGPALVIGDLAIVSLDAAQPALAPHTLLGITARYVVAYVDGWLVYVAADGATLAAVRFDERTGRISGAPVTVLREPAGSIEGISLGDDGTLMYTRRTSMNVPVLVRADGVAEPLSTGTIGTAFMNPRLSPDGGRLAFHGESPQGSDVWIHDLATHATARLTVTGNAYLPTWTPDGRRVVFLSSQSGRDAFWAQAADGSAPAEKIVEADGLFAGTVTPDGRTLLVQRQVGNVWGIWAAALDGDHTPRVVLAEPFDDFMPAVSPDGRWLAYVSTSSGRQEVYARPYPGRAAPVQISEGGGSEPAWSRDGRRIFYRTGTSLVAATLARGPALAVTARAALFADPFDSGMPHRNYDVALDGTRFVMFSTPASATPRTVVVLNWLTELRAAVAGR